MTYPGGDLNPRVEDIFIHVLSVDHVIIEVLKFASNLETGLIVYLLFCFLPCQKKKESLWNIFIVIMQPCLEGALK